MTNKAYENWLNDLTERYAELVRGESQGVSLEDAFARFEAVHQAYLEHRTEKCARFSEKSDA